MHLVAFIIRIYHDTRSPECQTLVDICSVYGIYGRISLTLWRRNYFFKF